MSTEPFIPLRIVQAIGITTTAFLAGTNFSISFSIVPRLLESPTPLLLRQWRATFKSGQTTIAPVSGLCGVIFLYLSYYTHQSPLLSHKWKPYALAGASALGIVPWTLGVMYPTINKLLKKAEETAALANTDEVVEVGLGGETAHALVDKWGVLNLGRAALLTFAAALGTWTALDG